MIVIRRLALVELARADEIDVTEDGTVVLEQLGTTIRSREEEWHRPPRTRERWREFEARWRAFIPDGGSAFGAFASDARSTPASPPSALRRSIDRDRLVGIATLRRSIRPGIDQLEALFVDRGHRRRGVARALVEEAAREARRGGAVVLYVSATPSESAVGFYLSRGFRQTQEPIPELLALEPEDVHMVLDLGRCEEGAPADP